MRIVCVYVPHFYVQVERLRRPELKGIPFIIGGFPEDKAYVADCSDEAAEKGASPSLSLREAHRLCPEALFLTPERGHYLDIWEGILYSLGAFSLRIESESEGLAYLDITKTPRNIYGSEEAIASGIVRALFESLRLTVRAGVANSRFAARQAAFHARDLLVIEGGGEKAFLSSLHADVLPVDDEIRERLRLLGLKSFGKIASLSREALVNQFGSAGRLMWECVCGLEEKRPIPVRRRKDCFEKEVTGDDPFETRERLGAALNDALAGMCRQLRATGMACRALKVILFFENKSRNEKTFAFKNPADSEKDMLSRVLDFLEGATLKGPVTGFRVSIPEMCRKEGSQETLFRKRPAFSERLEGVKGYCAAKFGYTPLFVVEERDKDSRLPERRFIVREV